MTPFTIIVPTRERCDTLRSTLRSCVHQDYDPLKIVVSDNASTDATEDVVRELRDPRVQYLRTDRRLSMASNWEFALQHVDDGFVTVLGDDDGLLPHAISDVSGILHETGCEAMGWHQATYTWPSCAGGKVPNRLKFRLGGAYEVRESRRVLAEVIQYQRVYKELPALYWGVAHRDLLRRLTPASGRFFNCVNPDVYSSIAIAMQSERYVWSSRPYSLQGLSRHSTGVSFVSGDRGGDSNVGKFWKEIDLPIHPDVAMVPSEAVYLTEAYAQARDHVPGGTGFASPNYAAMFRAAMRECARTPHRAAYDLVRDAVLGMGDRHGLEHDAHAAIDANAYLGDQHRESPRGINPFRETISIDCDDFQVGDVFAASQLCFYALGLYKHDYLSPRGIATSVVRRAVDRLDRVRSRLRPRS